MPLTPGTRLGPFEINGGVTPLLDGEQDEAAGRISPDGRFRRFSGYVLLERTGGV